MIILAHNSPQCFHAILQGDKFYRHVLLPTYQPPNGVRPDLSSTLLVPSITIQVALPTSGPAYSFPWGHVPPPSLDLVADCVRVGDEALRFRNGFQAD